MNTFTSSRRTFLERGGQAKNPLQSNEMPPLSLSSSDKCRQDSGMYGKLQRSSFQFCFCVDLIFDRFTPEGLLYDLLPQYRALTAWTRLSQKTAQDRTNNMLLCNFYIEVSMLQVEPRIEAMKKSSVPLCFSPIQGGLYYNRPGKSSSRFLTRFLRILCQ